MRWPENPRADPGQHRQRVHSGALPVDPLCGCALVGAGHGNGRQGKADGSINSLIGARYQISRQYRDRLQVTSTVGTDPARSTATSREATELHSILDKALLSIPLKKSTR
jgi:hypothetical protein